MNGSELLGLFGHFLLLSFLAFGGATVVAPDMHRYVVTDKAWMSAADFSTAFTLGQVAPGPNLLFVTLIGWKVAGFEGALATTAGMLAPSTMIALIAHHAVERWREHRLLRAFRTGLAPVTVGLTLATGWLLAVGADTDPAKAALTAATVAIVASTKRLNPLWLIAAAGAAGALGWI